MVKSNNKIGLISIVGLVVLLVAVSGCTSSGGNSTYTYGKVSFLAPDNMANSTSSGDIITGSDAWTKVAYMSNSNGVNILLEKASGSVSPEESQLATEISDKENNGTVLSTTHGTNPNGVMIYEEVNTLTSPSDNTVLKYYDMSFSGTDGNTYALQVYGEQGSSSVSEARDMVYNSLKA
jgi:hypothetical protein